jgi:hypothetical protein
MARQEGDSDARAFGRGSALLRPDAATLRHTPASGRLMPRVVGMHCSRPIRATMDRWAAQVTGQNCLGEPSPTAFYTLLDATKLTLFSDQVFNCQNSEATKWVGIVEGTYT